LDSKDKRRNNSKIFPIKTLLYFRNGLIRFFYGENIHVLPPEPIPNEFFIFKNPINFKKKLSPNS